jgi:hypothetical protein
MPAAGYAAGEASHFLARSQEQCRLIEIEFNRGDGQHSYLPSIATAALVLLRHMPASDPVLWRKSPPIQMENVMRGRVMMILASAVLAGSLVATGAQARGGGGGGGGHGGGGFGGGHMGGFGGAHMGGFGDGRIGGFGGGAMAHVGHDHFGGGRRFIGRGFYGDGLDCPYYSSYTWPYTCTY